MKFLTLHVISMMKRIGEIMLFTLFLLKSKFIFVILIYIFKYETFSPLISIDIDSIFLSFRTKILQF